MSPKAKLLTAKRLVFHQEVNVEDKYAVIFFFLNPRLPTSNVWNCIFFEIKILGKMHFFHIM